MNKHIFYFLLSLTMVLGLTLGLSPTAYAQVTEVNNSEEFVNAVNNGNNVKLVANFNGSIDYLYFTKETTIDLNGHTMSVRLGNVSHFYIKAHLTIKDGSSDGNGTLIFENSTTQTPFLINREGSLTLESGNLHFIGTSIKGTDVGGPFTMTGGTIESTGSSIWRNGNNVSISGGTIKGGFCGDNGEIDITGGKFNFDPSDLLKNGYVSFPKKR